MTCPQVPDCGVAIPIGACPPATVAVCPPLACTPSSYTCGDWTTTTNADCSTTRTRTSTNLVDGVFHNASLMVANGCITRVVAGDRVIQMRPEPCSSATGSVPTPPSGVTLSPMPCNLLSGDEDNLYANVTFNQAGRNITITGCGTPASPFVAQSTATGTLSTITSGTLAVVSAAGTATINSVGVTYNACGTQITAGIVKSYTPGPSSITGSTGIAVTASTCAVALVWDESTAKLSSKTVMGVSCGTAFVDPATGFAPAGGSWVTASLVVVGSRLFANAAGPITIYNADGIAIWTGSGFQTFASPELAFAALSASYAFAANGAC